MGPIVSVRFGRLPFRFHLVTAFLFPVIIGGLSCAYEPGTIARIAVAITSGLAITCVILLHELFRTYIYIRVAIQMAS
jgi:hypothetical protein